MSNGSPPLPATLAATLNPVLPELADEIIGAIRDEVPAYRRSMSGRLERNVRLGVERALGRFVAGIAEGMPQTPPEGQVYADLGRLEFGEGRSLDSLLAAYRVGARVAWRRISKAALGGGFDAATIAGLGEAIFEYIDGLSSESADGYARAQAAAAGELDAARTRLVELLAGGESDPAALAAASERARFEPPREIAAIAAPEAEPTRLATRIGDGAVGGKLAAAAVVLVPDPAAPGRLDAIERRLGEVAAVIGPPARWERAHESIHQALLGLSLAGREGPVRTDEHLIELLVHGEPAVSARIGELALGRIHELGPGPRRRLLATLRAWLDEQGRIEPTARALDVHPQTVRYRLRQLRDLYPDLDDPERRLGLALALRASPGP